MKKGNLKSKKSNKGITLLALVISIIVLLIIAGVTLSVTLGPNGVIQRAKDTDFATEKAFVEEQLKLKAAENSVQQYTNGTLEEMVKLGYVQRLLEGNDLTYVVLPQKMGLTTQRGNGVPSSRKDVYVANNDFTIYYLDKEGNELGEKKEVTKLEDDTILNFSDTAMREEVARRLGLDGDIYYRDLKEVKTLEIMATNIDNLDDLQYMPKLEKIMLNSGRFENINGLSNLSKLTYFNANNCSCNDYSGLAGLINVENFCWQNSRTLLDLEKLIDAIANLEHINYMDLHGNDFSDISSLSKLKSKQTMTSINFWGGNVNDISVISEFENLITFQVPYNKVQDITPIKNLKKLKTVIARNNQITNLDGLKVNQLESLTTLDLKTNQLTSIEGINAINSIQTLGLYGNPELTDEKIKTTISSLTNLVNFSANISAIKDIETIYTLDFYGTDITTEELMLLKGSKLAQTVQKVNLVDTTIENLDAFSDCTSLTSISLYGNSNLQDVSGIANIKSLRTISLGKCSKLTDISVLEELLPNVTISGDNGTLRALANCKNLKRLRFLSNSSIYISNLSGIEQMPNLTELYLQGGHRFTDLKPLTGLKNLEILAITYTKITNIADLKELNKLRDLNLSNNTIYQGLEALENMPNLVKLDLSNNSIRDITSIKKLTQLQSLKISGNYLTEAQKQELKDIFGNRVTV